MRILLSLIGAGIVASTFAWAEPVLPEPRQLEGAFKSSTELLLQNINRADVRRGAVIASPSREAPDYFYHWTRDAALVHKSLFQLFNASDDRDLKSQLQNMVKDWIAFESLTQHNAQWAEGGLGEPRYHVDGNVNTAPWGRPQTDGPAARAITMILWANKFLDDGDSHYVRNKLYRNELPAMSPIKRDLEYTAYQWKASSFDLWEETRGLHFYTLATQRKALLMGAQLADRLDDGGAADFYRKVAGDIKNEMYRFLNAGKPYVVVTLDQAGGWGHKQSGLDISIVLAVNQVLHDDEFFLSQKNIFNETIGQLERSFHNIYGINQDSNYATAMGRYPEDVYDGSGFSGANPWFIATHAAAEYYCKLAKHESGALAENLKKRGLSYFARTLRHRNQETGEMTEQFSRHNGYMVGARHLTWSYASYLTAYLACR